MPFPGDIDSLANGTLLFSACAAILYLLMIGREPSWRRTLIKTLSIALLAALTLIEGGPMLLVLALLLSAAGDAFLAHEDERPFLAGLVSFLAAHLVYVALFWSMGGGMEILSVQPWRLTVPAVAAIAALALSVRLLPVAGALRVPIIAYMAAILTMMLTAATVAPPLVMLGAALFVASDMLLAIQRFLPDRDEFRSNRPEFMNAIDSRETERDAGGKPLHTFPHPALAPGARLRPATGAALWVLYWLAQVTITLGLLLN